VTTRGYALLSLLAREPLSGYDLARSMRVPVGFFWPSSSNRD
jgi:DNA-binding PadR family transcriptional regulator